MKQQVAGVEGEEKHYIYIGIDGGGTKTACVALTHRRTSSHIDNGINNVHDNDLITLSRCEVGATNPNSVGKDQAKQRLHDGIKQLIENANHRSDSDTRSTTSDPQQQQQHRSTSRYTLHDIHSITLTISGCNNENDSLMMEQWIKELFLHNNSTTSSTSLSHIPYIKAYNDAIGALVSGTNGILHGIAVICGTGHMTWGKKIIHTKTKTSLASNDHKNTIENNDEPIIEEHIAGGNGCLIDGGGGFTIGLDVAKACFQHSDGMGQKTAMYDTLMKQLQLKHINELVTFVYTELSWSKIASLAPIALQHATTDPLKAQQSCDQHTDIYHSYQPAHQQQNRYIFQPNDPIAYQITQNTIKWLVLSIVTVIEKLEYNRDELLTIVLEGGINNCRYIFESVADGVYHELKRRHNDNEHQVEFTRPRVKAEMGSAMLGYRMHPR